MSENGDSYMLELEMPGVSKDGLEISIENNELSIVGRRSNPSIQGTLLHRESRPHNYRRTFEIDPTSTLDPYSAGLRRRLLPALGHLPVSMMSAG